MIVNNASLAAVGVKEEQYPKTGLPEIAFAGKSNVGKSSLINALLRRKALARTSSQPGKTQTINFYNVEDSLYFVDLPGYGYARVSRSERERWAKMIDDYLHTRQTLLQVILLVDGRHEPSANDVQMMEWIRSFGYQPLVIATKMDKLGKQQHGKALKLIRQTLKIENDQLFPFSALNKTGTEEIWQHLDELLASITEEESKEE
ncbi:MAG: ribosome biogenesis GTP-binding protein YihA/YsxC [Eubacteriales bacterium]|nr:ribosome biogenesis GTP-binding protein YihA/YsxC [Eubacteriales bacterium]